MVIFSPLAGVLVAHWNRRWVMILCDSGAAITTLIVVGLLFTEHLAIWHLYLLSAISSNILWVEFPQAIRWTHGLTLLFCE